MSFIPAVLLLAVLTISVHAEVIRIGEPTTLHLN